VRKLSVLDGASAQCSTRQHLGMARGIREAWARPESLQLCKKLTAGMEKGKFTT